MLRRKAKVRNNHPWMTQQLGLDGVNVLGEFWRRLWIRNGGLAFDSRFSFQVSLGPAEVTKPRGEVVVDPKPRKRSNSFSDAYRRIGTLMVPLLNTNILLKLAMLHPRRVVSIKLIKIKFQARKCSSFSLSIYTTLFRITALDSTCSSDED